MNTRITVLAMLLLAGAAASPSAAVESVLGAAGEVFKVRTATLQELGLPGGSPPSPDSPDAPEPAGEPLALAVDVLLPGSGDLHTHVVPGTEGMEGLSPRLMIFEDSSETLYLFWESESLEGARELHIAAWSGEEWLDVAAVEGNPQALRDDQRHTVTHDSFRIELSEEESIEVHRTILHLIWSEQRSSGGTAEKVQVYTPIVFADGRYIGWNPLFVLNDFDPGEEPEEQAEISARLLGAPALRQGQDSRTVVATFANARTAQVLSLEIEVLPLELGHLSDEIRAQIINMGSLFDQGDATALAEEIRAQIINMGSTYNPAFLEFLAAEVGGYVGEHAASAPDLATLAAEVRDLAIDTGAALISNDFGQTVAGGSTIIELDLSGLQIPAGSSSAAPGTIPEPSQILDLRLMASRQAPETENRKTTLYSSASGDRLLVAWEGAERATLDYLESTREGWSEPRSLVLGENLSLSEAHDLLRRKVD